jgi:hypothetical protein
MDKTSFVSAQLSSLLLCCMLCILGIQQRDIFAQSKNASANRSTDNSRELTNTDTSLSNNSSETVRLLKQQNQMLSEYNDKLLATVEWSLLFAAAFLLAFLGLVGYLTNRRSEQDKEALKSILEARVAETQSHLDVQIETVKGQLQKEQIASFGHLTESLEQLSTSAAQASVSPLQRHINTIGRDLLILKRDVLRAQATQHERDNVLGNALTCYSEIARIGEELGAGWNWLVSDALKEMERLLVQGGSFHPDDTRKLSQFLRGLPPEYEPLVKGVLSRL